MKSLVILFNMGASAHFGKQEMRLAKS